MCAVDGMRHGSHGVYSGGDSSEDYPLERLVQRESQYDAGNAGADY